MARPTHLEPSDLRLVVDVDPPALDDDTHFIARMLCRTLSAEQVTDLVRILQDPTE